MSDRILEVDNLSVAFRGEEVVRRDYPIMFGTLFCFTFLGLILTLIGDITYTLVDPRIDFETRET